MVAKINGLENSSFWQKKVGATLFQSRKLCDVIRNFSTEKAVQCTNIITLGKYIFLNKLPILYKNCLFNLTKKIFRIFFRLKKLGQPGGGRVFNFSETYDMIFRNILI